MIVGKLEKLPAFLLIENSKQEVAQGAVFDPRKFNVDQSLFQEEPNQRDLVVTVPKSPQALQDAGDAQVVVCVTTKKVNGIKIWMKL